MKRPRSQRLVSEINITPFTDVILVLLVLFMVTTPLIFRSSFKIQLPQSSSTQEPPRDINIFINSSGQASIENNQYNLRFDLEILKFKLASLTKNSSNTSLVINGDKKVEYDFVIKVIDIASQLGIKHIVLATDRKK